MDQPIKVTSDPEESSCVLIYGQGCTIALDGMDQVRVVHDLLSEHLASMTEPTPPAAPDPRSEAAWRFVALIERIIPTVDTPTTKLDRVYGALVSLHKELDLIGPAVTKPDPGEPEQANRTYPPIHGGGLNV